MAIATPPDAGAGDADDGGDGDGAIFAEINITPLTDIFLVLLIIFMVGTTVAAQKIRDEARQEKSSGLKINLPSGQAQEIDPGRKSIVVGVQQGGQVVVNGQPVQEADLDRVFLSAFTTDKDTQVVIRADAGVQHGRVVGIMERARTVGLTRLAIATKGK
jgi:biopolymer transport protein ExbD